MYLSTHQRIMCISKAVNESDQEGRHHLTALDAPHRSGEIQQPPLHTFATLSYKQPKQRDCMWPTSCHAMASAHTSHLKEGDSD